MPDTGSRPLLTVVSPVYRAEGIVDELVTRLRQELAPLGTYEIVLVDDRSPDASWDRIVANCGQHPEVVGVRLSRNVGQHPAISAGLSVARGEYVVVIDCDLQENPKYIGDLLAQARDGADIVYTYKRRREHSRFRNLTARSYFAVLEFLRADDAHLTRMGVGSFSLITRRVVDAYARIGDVHAHYLSNLQRLGFRSAQVEIEHEPRFEGRSSYSFGKLLRHAVDGIVSQSVRLLNVATALGFGLFALSLVGAAYLVISYLVRGALVGYTSLMVMFLLLAGVILMSIGVLGLYVGRIFEQVKGVPPFIIDRVVREADER